MFAICTGCRARHEKPHFNPRYKHACPDCGGRLLPAKASVCPACRDDDHIQSALYLLPETLTDWTCHQGHHNRT